MTDATPALAPDPAVAAERPLTSADLTPQFTRAKEPEVREIRETLVALARAHPGDTKGTFVR